MVILLKEEGKLRASTEEEMVEQDGVVSALRVLVETY